jgi:hypothetical protein
MRVDISELRSMLGNKEKWHLVVGRLNDEPSRVYVRDMITKAIGDRKFIQNITGRANLNNIPTLYFVDWLRSLVEGMEFENEDDQYVAGRVIREILNPLCEDLHGNLKKFEGWPAPVFFKHECSSEIQEFLKAMAVFCKFKGSTQKYSRQAMPAYFMTVLAEWVYSNYTKKVVVIEAEKKFLKTLSLEERVDYNINKHKVRNVYKKAIEQNLIEYYLKREFGF